MAASAPSGITTITPMNLTRNFSRLDAGCSRKAMRCCLLLRLTKMLVPESMT